MTSTMIKIISSSSETKVQCELEREREKESERESDIELNCLILFSIHYKVLLNIKWLFTFILNLMFFKTVKIQGKCIQNPEK